MACAAPFNVAKVCVEGDPATCSCFVPPFDSFQDQVKSGYRMSMAFEIPGTPEFCNAANDNTCVSLEQTSCCCQQEIYDYVDCAFTNELNTAFGAGDCAFSRCGQGDEGGGGGGGSMMIIIIAIVVVLLCCCGGGFYYKRRVAANDEDEDKSTDGKDVSLLNGNW